MKRAIPVLRLHWLALLLIWPLLLQAAEPLNSWNDGPSKKAIIEFVQAVTTPGS
ncbi:MAG: haloacid dehalogenase-like hydrolase, partial [Pseudomonas sp.]